MGGLRFLFREKISYSHNNMFICYFYTSKWYFKSISAYMFSITNQFLLFFYIAEYWVIKWQKAYCYVLKTKNYFLVALKFLFVFKNVLRAHELFFSSICTSFLNCKIIRERWPWVGKTVNTWFSISYSRNQNCIVQTLFW